MTRVIMPIIVFCSFELSAALAVALMLQAAAMASVLSVVA